MIREEGAETDKNLKMNPFSLFYFLKLPIFKRNLKNDFLILIAFDLLNY